MVVVGSVNTNELRPTLTVLAKEAVREAELASALFRVPPTVPGKHLIMSGGLWGLCSVINKLKLLLSINITVAIH